MSKRPGGEAQFKKDVRRARKRKKDINKSRHAGPRIMSGAGCDPASRSRGARGSFLVLVAWERGHPGRVAGWKPALLETHPGPVGHPSREGIALSPLGRERGNVSTSTCLSKDTFPFCAAQRPPRVQSKGRSGVPMRACPIPFFIFVHAFCSFLPMWAAIYAALRVYSCG